MSKVFIFLLAIILLLGGALPSLSQPALAQGAVYNTAFLTDEQLEDYTAMTAEQIRQFLVDHNSYFQQPIQDVDGVTFDPADTIAQAATQYQINPQVLLTTLQKESVGVTRSTRPSDDMLPFIMGCISSSTARQQLVCAAERFRAYHDQLTNTGSTVSGWQVGVPKETVDGVTVTPANKAVAGQFTYTPHAGVQWGGNDPQWGGVYLFCYYWNAFGFGSQNQGFDVSLVSCDSQNFPFVYVTVNVKQDGLPIDYLTKADFIIMKDGRVQTDMFDVTPPQAGGAVRLADIVFLIDTSGSMGGEIAAVRNNCIAFANNLAASEIDYRLGLVSFGNYAGANPGIVGGGLTDSADTFKGWVGTLGAYGGYEPGFAAIRLAIENYNFRPGAQKVFILITDEDSDDRNKEATINLILANDVTVHVAANCGYGSSQSDYCGTGSVRDVSGGLLFAVTDDYITILDTISGAVADTYILRYRTDNPVRDGVERNGLCIIDDGTDIGAVVFTYIPGGAPEIQRTQQTVDLHNQALVAGSSPTISVTVVDVAAPYVQSVTLRVRTSGTTSGYAAISMSHQGGDLYSAQVPGSVVQAPGIDYYIRATDGQVTSSDPSTDPDIMPYQIAVLPNMPPMITHTPPAVWGVDSNVELVVEATDSTYSLQSISVYYRRQGDLLWETSGIAWAMPLPTSATVTLTLEVATWSAPALEYYIKATDDLGISSLLPEGGADAPYTLEVLTVDPGRSTVEANPLLVPADGFSASTVTVTLVDTNSNPVPNWPVSIQSEPWIIVDEPSLTTNANGQATTDIRSLREGQATIIAIAPSGGTGFIEWTVPMTFEKRWYVLDGHVHTYHSARLDIDPGWDFCKEDKDNGPQYKAEWASNNDVADALMITDHDQMLQLGLMEELEWMMIQTECSLAEFNVGRDPIVMAGSEMGGLPVVGTGHILAYGIDEYVKGNNLNTPFVNDEQNNIDRINEAGGFSFLPHPLKGMPWPRDLWDDEGYAGIELLNGKDSEASETTLTSWDKLIREHYWDILYRGKAEEGQQRWIGIGNSDAHCTSDIGNSITYVCLDGMLTHDNLFDALRAGHAVASKGPMVMFYFEYEGKFYPIGSTVEAKVNDQATLHVVWDNMDAGTLKRIVVKKKGILSDMESVLTIASGALTETAGEAHTYVSFDDSTYYRLEAEIETQTGDDGAVYTNPIFVKATGQSAAFDLDAFDFIVVPPWETAQTTVPVMEDWVDGIFRIDWDGSTVGLTLVNPNGVVITPGFLPAGAYYEAGATYAFYQIAQPIPGTWTMLAEGVDVPPEGENVYFNVWSRISTQPQVNIVEPTEGDRLSGLVNIVSEAVDAEGIAEVSCYVDDVSLGNSISPPYEFPWDTSGFGDGMHVVSVWARDIEGNTDGSTLRVLVVNQPELQPVASAGEDKVVDVCENVTLDGSGSEVQPGLGSEYMWSFGNGDSAMGEIVDYIYHDPGTYTAMLVVWDETGSYATDEIQVNVINLAPVVSADPISQTVHYSDYISGVNIMATDICTDTMTASTSFDVDGGGFTPGLPEFLVLTDNGCSINVGTNNCTWSLWGIADVPAGEYTIRVTVEDDDGGQTSADTIITVDPEDASVSFDAANEVAVPVDTPGGDSGLFTLTVHVTETVPDLSDGASAPGNISLADVSMSLVPVGPGSPVSGVCTPNSVVGTGYDAALPVTCVFDNVPVNTYTVEVTVGGGYYTGNSEDVLVVYDPSLGFITGGGWFYWPDTDEKTNFGFTMKYNKKGNQVKGSLLLIRHLSDGTIYRLKSNALYGLALGEAGGSEKYGWASFSGKATYKEPGWLEPVGNYEFVTYVEDLNEPGKGHDQFWIEVYDRDRNMVPEMSMSSPVSGNTVTLDGGNIVVPHK